MYTFKIKVANIVVEANVMYEKTMTLCEEFFTDENPFFSITMSEEDIERAREETNKAEIALGREIKNSEPYCYEFSALLDKINREFIKHNILLLHGSVVAYKGKAYMFTAISGTGKTTHSKLWLKNIAGSYILNGDKPFLLFKDEKVFACGSPWMGKERYGINEILPLEAICLIERDKTNRIAPTTLKDLFSALYKQTIIPLDSSSITLVMTHIAKLSSVNLYRLFCNMEDEASIVAFNGIVKGEEK